MTDRGGRARRHLVPAVCLGAALVVLFAPVLLQGRVFYHRDIHLQWQPQMEALVRSVTAGSWPLWNPSPAFGQPLLGNPNLQILYPTTWLNLVLPPWTCYTLLVVGHFLLAAVGMYRLALWLRLTRQAALLAAAVWILGGPFVSLVDLWNHLCGAAWIPWSALAAARALGARGRWHEALTWGATVAAPILAGSPESALMAVLAGLAMAAAPAASAHRAGPRRVLATCAGAGAFALSLSAAQWLPALELARASVRAAADFPRSYWSLHPFTLSESLFPLFLDRLPLHWELRGALYEFREPFLASIYLGIGTGVLMLSALPRPRRQRLTLLLVALVAGCVIFSLGRHTPLYALALAAFPPLQALRFPAKAMVLASFAWALLAGLGLDQWRRASVARARLIAGCLGTLTLAGALLTTLAWWGADEWGSALLFRGASSRSFGQILQPLVSRVGVASLSALGLLLLTLVRFSPRLRVALAIVLVVGDLLVAHQGLHPTATPDLFRYRPPAADLLRQAVDQRVYAYDYFVPGKSWQHLGHRASYLTQLPEEQWPFRAYEALALRGTLYASVLGTWGLEAGYTSDPLGLFPAYLESITALLYRTEASPFHRRLLQMGGIGWVTALHSHGFEGLARVASYPTLMVEPLHVFAVPAPLPRAFAVDGVRVADGAQALQTLLDPGFDPAREILVPSGTGQPPGAGSPGTVAIHERRPDQVFLDASLARPAHVVLLDGFAPGWKATLDDAAVEVVRANVAFRAVAVPAGQHRISFRYRPASVLWGAGISTAALLLAAAAGLLRLTRT